MRVKIGARFWKKCYHIHFRKIDGVLLVVKRSFFCCQSRQCHCKSWKNNNGNKCRAKSSFKCFFHYTNHLKIIIILFALKCNSMNKLRIILLKFDEEKYNPTSIYTNWLILISNSVFFCDSSDWIKSPEMLYFFQAQRWGFPHRCLHFRVFTKQKNARMRVRYCIAYTDFKKIVRMTLTAIRFLLLKRRLWRMI